MIDAQKKDIRPPEDALHGWNMGIGVAIIYLCIGLLVGYQVGMCKGTHKQKQMDTAEFWLDVNTRDTARLLQYFK